MAAARKEQREVSEGVCVVLAEYYPERQRENGGHGFCGISCFCRSRKWTRVPCYFGDFSVFFYSD